MSTVQPLTPYEQGRQDRENELLRLSATKAKEFTQDVLRAASLRLDCDEEQIRRLGSGPQDIYRKRVLIMVLSELDMPAAEAREILGMKDRIHKYHLHQAMTLRDLHPSFQRAVNAIIKQIDSNPTQIENTCKQNH